ncbi:MAG TPA: hypothetical protein VG106_05840 [Vicinamibacterales bacterium]|nr:hypothetical protein [Vicinamibacterales bacterium]
MGEIQRVLLIDWPSREVPDSLARAGFSVTAQERDGTYAAYEMDGAVVARRDVEEPEGVDAVYAYRPLDELAEIADVAARLGATTLYWETGPSPATPQDVARARQVVERAGLDFVHGRISHHLAVGE